MSSTWRGESEQSRTKAAGRLRKRSPVGGASLALPAVVMIVLGAAFVMWFLIGAPPGGGQLGQANATTPIRTPVQPPQIASAALVDARVSEPAPPPELPALILSGEPETAAPAADGMMPLALQSTRQISTPAPMTAVVGEPQQISAPRAAPPVPPAPPERRAPPPPGPAPGGRAAPASSPPPKAAVAAAVASAPAAATAETDKPARFAIILASVETESEARAKVGQFKQKFASLLGARRLNYHRTRQDGALVWHVRSTGLTEADAEELCEQIERAGGECAAWPQ